MLKSYERLQNEEFYSRCGGWYRGLHHWVFGPGPTAGQRCEQGPRSSQGGSAIKQAVLPGILVNQKDMLWLTSKDRSAIIYVYAKKLAYSVAKQVGNFYLKL